MVSFAESDALRRSAPSGKIPGAPLVTQKKILAGSSWF